jgi:hypothetical protein
MQIVEREHYYASLWKSGSAARRSRAFSRGNNAFLVSIRKDVNEVSGYSLIAQTFPAPKPILIWFSASQ